MRERYVNFTIANHDLFHKTLDDLALVLRWQRRPAVIERAGFMQDVVGGQLIDFEAIHLGLPDAATMIIIPATENFVAHRIRQLCQPVDMETSMRDKIFTEPDAVALLTRLIGKFSVTDPKNNFTGLTWTAPKGFGVEAFG